MNKDNVQISETLLVQLLRVARCPDTDCINGVVPYGPDPDGHWEAAQCQWCYERKLVMDFIDDEQ